MRELILIRGLPGSGKTTMAKQYHGSYIHLETDMFWGPDYKIDLSRLQEAHEWCQQSTRIFLANYSVIVSNTFTTKKELYPYFDIASDYGIVPQIILCLNQFGSVHKVPKEVMQKMRDRFEYEVEYNEYGDYK